MRLQELQQSLRSEFTLSLSKRTINLLRVNRRLFYYPLIWVQFTIIWISDCVSTNYTIYFRKKCFLLRRSEVTSVSCRR